MMQVETGALSSTVEFLTAMITPVLLMSATGTMVLSTSTRLGRVIDRVRALEGRLGELVYAEDPSAIPYHDRRLAAVFDLLDKVTSRSRLLQRAMVVFYYGLGLFVLTSVSIAAVGLLNIYRWTPIVIGLIGISYLTYGCLLLMVEARMATSTVNSEMDFTWSIAREDAPRELREKYPEKGMFGNSALSIVMMDFRRRIDRIFGTPKF